MSLTKKAPTLEETLLRFRDSEENIRLAVSKMDAYLVSLYRSNADKDKQLEALQKQIIDMQVERIEYVPTMLVTDPDGNLLHIERDTNRRSRHLIAKHVSNREYHQWRGDAWHLTANPDYIP